MADRGAVAIIELLVISKVVHIRTQDYIETLSPLYSKPRLNKFKCLIVDLTIQD